MSPECLFDESPVTTYSKEAAAAAAVFGQDGVFVGVLWDGFDSSAS